MKTRNYNIDFLRGVATICVIIIHTAFWSGEAYLPPWFSNLSLLIDVPAFIYIAGISYTYVNSVNKNIKGIIIQWKKWLYFLIFYTLIILLFFHSEFTLKDIFNWMFYSFPKENSLIVVQGSIWFIIMYIKVTIFCTIIIGTNRHFEEKEEKKNSNLIRIIILIFIIFSYTTLSNNGLGIFDNYLLFYSMIYLIGYVSSKYKITLKQMITYEVFDILLLIIVFIAFGYNVTNFQTVKFPPTFPYIFVAMISIILFAYLKDNFRIKDNNKISYIGKYAIQFYFAQGVASSFLIKIYNYMPHINKYLLFIIMLGLNITLTLIGGIFFEKTYQYFRVKINNNKLKSKLLPKLKEKKEL